MPSGSDVLSAALGAGLALPHSCRAGRCASCKAQLRSGEIHYPRGLPPGLTAVEAARGAVLLCQAHPRSDLVVEVQRVAAPARFVVAELVSLTLRPLAAIELRVRPQAPLAVRPGQFLDVRGPSGDIDRLPVVGADGESLSLESAASDADLHRWLLGGPSPGSILHLAGPHEGPR